MEPKQKNVIGVFPQDSLANEWNHNMQGHLLNVDLSVPLDPRSINHPSWLMYKTFA